MVFVITYQAQRTGEIRRDDLEEKRKEKAAMM
jgi:hypothetical protein